MNEQTAKLIEELASKLGTTAEHLWGVLVRQAPISAVTDILTSILIILLIWVSLKFVQRKTRETEDAPADWDEEGALAAWVIWGIASIIAILCVLCDINYIIAGFANPEYWALKQILH
jgi:hypothetical protein